MIILYPIPLSRKHEALPESASAKRIALPEPATARRISLPEPATARRIALPEPARARQIALPKPAAATREPKPLSAANISQPARAGVQSHYPALDGLRGIAILLVIAFHGMLMSPANLLDQVVASAASMGWIGVDLFFVISGFLITTILLESKGGRGYFGSFYARRALRVLPLYYVALAVYFFVFLPGRMNEMAGNYYRYHELEIINNLQPWLWLHGFNMWVTGHGGFPRISHLNHFWSLAIEEQFYLVWPVLVLALSRRQFRSLCLAMLCGTLGLRLLLTAQDNSPISLMMSTATRIDGLIIGALVALAATQRGGVRAIASPARKTLAVSAALLAVIVLAAGGFSPEKSVMVRTFGLTVVTVFFGSVVAIGAGLEAQSRWGRRLTHPALVSLGRYSYAIYVTHMIFYFAMMELGFHPGLIKPVLGSALPAQLVFHAVMIAGSYAMAWVSWRLIERHFIALKRFVPRPTAPPASAAPEPAEGLGPQPVKAS